MNQNDRDNSAERFLESALAKYSDVEPTSGFEVRLKARLAEQHGKQRVKLLRFAWIPIAASVVGVAAMTMLHDHHPRHVLPVSSPVSAMAVVPQSPTLGAKNESIKKNAPALRTSRRRAVFPRVTKAREARPVQPLSEQEILLLRYIANTPHEELETVARLQRQRQEELEQLQ